MNETLFSIANIAIWTGFGLLLGLPFPTAFLSAFIGDRVGYFLFSRGKEK